MNLIRILILILVINPVFQAKNAFATSDQAMDDMLTSSADHESENSDAVSRWSKENKRSKKAQSVSKAVPLAPISESSFENGSNRAPASVAPAATSSRAPAAVIAPTDHGVLPKTWTRTLQKRKVYQEVSVIANDLGFFPSTIFVTQGVPVKLFVTGASSKSQCFMLDSFGVRRQIKSQKIEEITFTPDQSGSFAFSCPMNGAKGSVVVKELDVGRLPASVDVSKNDSDERDEDEHHDDENENNFEK